MAKEWPDEDEGNIDWKTIKRLKSINKALETENTHQAKRLGAAGVLSRYAVHMMECPKRGGFLPNLMCTCGLDAALAGLEGA